MSIQIALNLTKPGDSDNADIAAIDNDMDLITTAVQSAAIDSDDGRLTTAKDVTGSINELFTSANNGKTIIKNAIIGKSGTVAGGDIPTNQELADGVNTISRGQGNAVEGQVLNGSTFSNVDGTLRTGTMANKGAVTIAPSTVNQAIPVGYHNGSGVVNGDVDLIANNILSGINIFGVDGNIIIPKSATGTIVIGDSNGQVTIPGYNTAVATITGLNFIAKTIIGYTFKPGSSGFEVMRCIFTSNGSFVSQDTNGSINYQFTGNSIIATDTTANFPICTNGNSNSRLVNNLYTLRWFAFSQ